MICLVRWPPRLDVEAWTVVVTQEVRPEAQTFEVMVLLRTMANWEPMALWRLDLSWVSVGVVIDRARFRVVSFVTISATSCCISRARFYSL